MKKTVLKIVVSVLFFVLTVFVAGGVMNRDNVNTTRSMDAAKLPVVSVNYNGSIINDLYGYTGSMDFSLLRDTITPLDDSRGVSFRVQKFGKHITGITARVRAVDDSRLIEVVDVTDFTEDDYYIFFDVAFKDLLTEYTEYSLELELTLSDGSFATYYTRIVSAPGYSAGEKLKFIEEFEEKKWSTATNEDLKTYMESNYLGDNTRLSYVNIHSSMSQLAFGNLSMSQVSDSSIAIRELNTETAVFTSEYVAKSNLYQEEKLYFVRDYYRIKYTPGETYLLDYERTMEEIHLNPKEMVREDDILLGISPELPELLENDDGNTFVFSEGGRLYSYNISENKLALLFTFYDESNFDTRTYHGDYKIKPLSIDEAGNVRFIVYGYMNRGTYEGKVGIILYDYNGVTNVNEELCFINSDQPADILIKNVDELSYMNPDGILYIRVNEDIYEIDPAEEKANVVISNLTENRYTVSGDSSMLVWIDGKDVNAATHLNLMNLNNKDTSVIEAGAGEYIKPLSFIDNDLIYGLAKRQDVTKDDSGRINFPMYSMVIKNKTGITLKDYRMPGIYVSDIEIKDNLITIHRVEKTGEDEARYVIASDDYITDNQEQKENQNLVNEFVNGDYETVVRITLKKDNSGKAIVLTPREVIYEGNKELALPAGTEDIDRYYVYYKGKLQSIWTNPAKAVSEADENYGTVLNQKGFYVWYRANRLIKNQIMDMTTQETDTEKESLAVCLDRIMAYEGEVRNSKYLMNTGKSVMDILTENLADCDCLDLRGCSLDSVLYYVNRDFPVLVMTGSDAKLLIGYNSLEVVINDPEKGTYKMGINEAKSLFEQSGNQFITYVHNY